MSRADETSEPLARGRARSRRHVRSGGWTLVDAVMATALAAVVLVVVAQVMTGTSRLTRAQTLRNLQQTRLQAVAGKIERLLLTSPTAGVRWVRESDPRGAVLAIHPVQDGPLKNTPRWHPFWQCIVWDAETRHLWLLRHPAGNGAGAASTAQPQGLPEPEMRALLDETVSSDGAQGARMLLDRATDFRWSQEPGPLYRIEIEVDVPTFENQEETARNRLRFVKVIRPRF